MNKAGQVERNPIRVLANYPSTVITRGGRAYGMMGGGRIDENCSAEPWLQESKKTSLATSQRFESSESDLKTEEREETAGGTEKRRYRARLSGEAPTISPFATSILYVILARI